MYKNAEDWYERFKAAGGRGRVDIEKIWFSESGLLAPQAKALIEELTGPDNVQKRLEVVAYIQARYAGFVGWADF
jgi:hypothetical protein